MDAIEAFTEFSEVLCLDEVNKEFVPCVLSNLDIEQGDINVELLARVA